MGSEDASVARQRKTDSLCERVHRVCREHTRASATTRASHLLHLRQFLIADSRVATLHHRCDEVSILAVQLVRLHRTAAHKDCWNVQSHCSHQHSRRHFVAIGDANHGICLVRIHHKLDAVGYDVARG